MRPRLLVFRLFGFEITLAHRIFWREGQPIEQMSRKAQRAEIHMLAQGLGLKTRYERVGYERAIATFFRGKLSSAQLDDSEHSQFLSILRAWKRAKAVADDHAIIRRVA